MNPDAVAPGTTHFMEYQKMLFFYLGSSITDVVGALRPAISLHSGGM
jgi:hypothetical protein